MQPKQATYITKDNHKITYNYLKGDKNLVIFLGGLMSDKEGTKAIFFEKHCDNKGYSYIRFDYLGHGQSDLKFTQCTIDTWLDNVIEIINHFASDKVTLIGSSLGGWLMCLIARKYPDKINGLIGIATATDFTENLIWNNLSNSQQKQLQSDNIYTIPACDDQSQPYPITMDLINSGRKHLLLNGTDTLDIGNIPIRLFHGMLDNDVPYQYSIKLADKITSSNIEITLIKNGDHRLSDNITLNNIARSLDQFF